MNPQWSGNLRCAQTINQIALSSVSADFARASGENKHGRGGNGDMILQ